MKGAMLYVNAGKGHYTPAVALAESFNNAGHNAIAEDLFTVVGAPFWEWFCKYDWRFLLHHPHLEGLSHRITDNRLSFYLIRWQGLSKKHLSNLYNWYIKHKPDFIVSTNFIGGIILPSALKKLGINIPVFQYAADVFDTPLSGINNDLTKMYLPTEIGCKNAIRKGQNKETVSICPFPLQSYIKNSPHITQQEARKKLGLKNKFTVLFALGGEGIGHPDFLYKMVERGYNWQIVAIGGMSKTTNAAFDKFCKEYPYVDFMRPGFVNNVNEYLIASNIQIGKAGANALMESIYMHRPCIISDLLYAARATKDFFAENEVGWCEGRTSKQVSIVESYYNNKSLLNDMADRYAKLPIKFSSDAFMEQIIKDTEDYYKQA